LKEKVRAFIEDANSEPRAFGEKPWVILVVGVNGTGKTTTIGKLGHRFKQEGRKVLLAGADTFRAAAAEQLEVWASRSGIPVITQKYGADPASVAYDALDHAVRHGTDVLIVDTAGRLHTKANLMEELKKIRRVLAKRMAFAPHETLLVLDATTGQNGLRQAEMFTQAAGVTGIVLTKLDGTARGGIVLGIKRETGIPVRWVGLGEGIDDLLPFDAEAFAEGLLGEG
jgi:fused signal recognition particle receptor